MPDTSSVTGVSQTVAEAMLKARTPSTTTTGSNELGKDAFLKLLVAQLKYQDPSKPTDSSTFMQQTASFTQVEKLEEMAKTTAELLATQSAMAGSAFLGRTVTYVGADGNEATGLVTGLKFAATGPTLRVGDTDVAVGAVKEVRTAG
ncbi:flagellar hook capping FlgD N-terminal domain-containing protein [Vallicoccus soli]|uniref:Flagellar hook capping protein n=1 Tax=Vallicoccus soli TaxID=2339232 RepID=A0A3A3YRE0_9ACTN|nr:flagellar hook capping FlgD N-terminal domain-containing protein [Vallicoccus soli]RJK92812.1 flagellar hook capping protein [Vallicoccus soli]